MKKDIQILTQFYQLTKGEGFLFFTWNPTNLILNCYLRSLMIKIGKIISSSLLLFSRRDI